MEYLKNILIDFSICKKIFFAKNKKMNGENYLEKGFSLFMRE